MIIQKRSIVSGKINEMDIPVTIDEINAWRDSRIPIQQCFPHLTDDQREFLLSGMTPAEWDETFPDE